MPEPWLQVAGFLKRFWWLKVTAFKRVGAFYSRRLARTPPGRRG
jgi:hypothetical protein